MGAGQSSEGAGRSAPAVEAKTSYYELLGIERTATDEEIKKAYRRKALELHPDRNYGDTERVTALFAEISSAYEVLSDPQERAWYDAHEGDILRGGEGGGDEHYEGNVRMTTAHDISRMMGQFRGNIDFSDSPTGFYGFLRELFDQLAKEEELSADWSGADLPNYPSFGHKDDTYEDVVRTFYAGWSGFSTRKSFSNKDQYRTSEAPDRRIRRIMEKENQRFRQEAIKEFNDAVRALVLFVRKRDPRYTPNTQSEEDRAKAQRAATQAQAARSRAAQAAKMQEAAVPNWATARDPEELEEDEDEEIEEEHYECVACHKTFKSEKQYDAHEKSKKHQKAVQALKRKMQKENAHLNLDEDAISSGVITPADDEASDPGYGSEVQHAVEEISNGLNSMEVHVEDSDDDDQAEQTDNMAEDKLEKPEPEPSSEPASSEESDDDYASRSDIEARLASFRHPPGSSTQPSTADTSTLDTPNLDDESVTTATPSEPKMGKAAQKRAKKAAKQAEMGDDQPESKFACKGCSKGFPSKNQLMQHLKDFPKHAALISTTKGAAAGKKGKKR